MATIRDVAKLAGVSPTTVSATLSGKAPVSEALQKRVWDAVKEANYRPDPLAQNLRRGSTMTVGFICPDIAAPWASHLGKAMQNALRERGYNMLLASNNDDPEQEFRDIALMTDHRVAGLIVAPTSHGQNYAQRLVDAVSCPAVMVDRCVAPDRFDIVADDNVLGGTLLADYLVRQGHQEIGFLVGRASISASSERFDAVSARLAALGHPLNPAFCRHDVHTVEGAYSAVQDLMSAPARPSAIMCISNLQLQGAMSGLFNMGLLVPDDVSVVSFDGFTPPEGWSPIITCLLQDTQTVCDRVVELLLDRMEQPETRETRQVRIQPKLRVGTSCKRI